MFMPIFTCVQTLWTLSYLSRPCGHPVYMCVCVWVDAQDLRRKAARLISAKTALAARVDSFHESLDGKVGDDLRLEMEGKFDKWQEPPPVKLVKPLPAPIDQAHKRRGGRRSAVGVMVTSHCFNFPCIPVVCRMLNIFGWFQHDRWMCDICHVWFLYFDATVDHCCHAHHLHCHIVTTDYPLCHVLCFSVVATCFIRLPPPLVVVTREYL